MSNTRLNPPFENIQIGDTVTDRFDTTFEYNTGVVMTKSREHLIVRMPDGSEEEWHRDIFA